MYNILFPDSLFCHGTLYLPQLGVKMMFLGFRVEGLGFVKFRVGNLGFLTIQAISPRMYGHRPFDFEFLVLHCLGPAINTQTPITL